MSLSTDQIFLVPEPGSRATVTSLTRAVACEKVPKSYCSMSSDLGWRSFLKTLVIDGAIISYITTGHDSGRYAYLVGLDEARDNSAIANGLIAYAERVWDTLRDDTIVSFRVDAGPGSEPVALLAGSIASTLLARFDHAAVARTISGGSTFSVLLLRAADAGPFSAECKRVLADVLPILSRAVAGDVAATCNERHSRLLEAMFDRVSLATFLVDPAGRPLFCNSAGKAILASRTPLLQSADGSIVCSTPSATRDFHAAIRSAAKANDPDQAEIVLRLESRNDSCQLAFILPATLRGGDALARTAMVLVHSPQNSEAPATLLEALGLLPSEQRFLISFLRTSSLGAAAEDTGLSEETARTYLKRVRAKLGVHRQMELAQLIYGLVPPLSRFCTQPAQ